jgi:hypothetical protein
MNTAQRSTKYWDVSVQSREKISHVGREGEMRMRRIMFVGIAVATVLAVGLDQLSLGDGTRASEDGQEGYLVVGRERISGVAFGLYEIWIDIVGKGSTSDRYTYYLEGETQSAKTIEGHALVDLILRADELKIRYNSYSSGLDLIYDLRCFVYPSP